MDWFTTTIASHTEGLPHDHAILSPPGPQRRRRLLRSTGPSPARPSRPDAADRPSTTTPARVEQRLRRRRPRRTPAENQRLRDPVAALADPPSIGPLDPAGGAWRSPPSPWASAPARSRTSSSPAPRRPAPITRPSPAGSPTRPRRPSPSWRRSTRRAPPGSGRSPWTRSFLGATDPGRDRAGEHDRRLLPQRRRPQGRDLAAATGPVRRLEFAVSDAAKGIAKAVCGAWPRPAATARRPRPWSTAWTSSTPRWRPDRVLARAWRRAEAAWEEAEAADARVGRARNSKASMREARPGRPRPPGGRASGRSRRSSGRSGLASGPRRAGAVRRRRPAQRPRPAPRRRSPRRWRA